MCDITLSELLVLFMLALSSSRVLYLRQARIDALASLPQIAFLISLLNIYIWGFSPLEIWIAVIAFFAFVLNMSAALKVWSYLYVDYYHPAFRILSLFTLFLALATAAVVVIFAPVLIKTPDISVSQYKYSGKFSTGFTHSTSKYDRANAILTVFSPKEQDDKVSFRVDNGDEVEGVFDGGKPILIFLGDKRASTKMYSPYLEKLAQDGYTVIAGEFFASDMKWVLNVPDTPHFRRFAINIADLNGSWDIEAKKGNSSGRYVKEFTMLLYLAGEFNNERKPFFLIGDEMASDALVLASGMYSDAVSGFFDMTSVTSYPAGYGFIEQTDPFLSFLHGRKREKTLALPHLLAARTEESIILTSEITINDTDDTEKEQKE